MILAHRGDSFRAPENTLEAAQLGFEAGADGWELDVRLSRDGVPVVIHDESLVRTTNAARVFEGDPRGARGFLVGEFTLEEIQSLDAGSWFLEPSGGARSASGFGTLDRIPDEIRSARDSGSIRVPTLAEALGLSARLGWMVNVEIKPATGNSVEVVDAVLAEIRARDCRELVAVSSFDREVVGLVAAREPGVATGALVLGAPDRDPSALLKELGADAIHAPPDGVDPAGWGVPVLVYTVNDGGLFGLARRLARAGVAGLFTDDPTSLAATFGVTQSAGRTRSR